MGGMIAAIEQGFPQREIASASYRYQREIEAGERVIVGANRFTSQEKPIELLQVSAAAEEVQRNKLTQLRAKRGQKQVSKTLGALVRAAETERNLMPLLLDCVRAYATLGEICEALQKVFGSYTETNHL